METYLRQAETRLNQAGYLTDRYPGIPGVQALLYARTPQHIILGVAKVNEHLLFMDWDNELFGRLEHLKQAYQRFRGHVNRDFKTPHALRMTLPNLALVALSQRSFPQDALAYAREHNLVPWYGGEIGQVILVEVPTRQITSLETLMNGRHPKPGAFGLSHAVEVVRMVSV